MTEIDNDWSQLAEDDGRRVLEANSYEAHLEFFSNEYSTNISSIRYSPSINKAKSITIDVPPHERLEEHTFLGGDLTVFVDNDILFEGDIVKIETSQVEGDDYTIVAEPPAKRMKGDDVNKVITDKSVYDSIGSIIDEYNEYDATHSELFQTEQQEDQNIEHIGGDVVGVDDPDADDINFIRFNNVGEEIQDIEKIYIKVYYPNGGLFALINNIAGNSPIIDEFESESGVTNRYGEWIEYSEFDTPYGGSYDLYFEFEFPGTVHDWIVITDNEIERKIFQPEIEEDDDYSDFYSRQGDSLTRSVISTDDGMVVDEGEVRTRQVSSWNTVYSESGSNDTFIETTSTVDDGLYAFSPGDSTNDVSDLFHDLENSFEQYKISIRLATEESGSSFDDLVWIQINLNDRERGFLLDDSNVDEINNYNWYHLDQTTSEPFIFPSTVRGDSFETKIDSIDYFAIGNASDSDHNVIIDAIVLTHRNDFPDESKNLNYTFDNTLNSENQLETPVLYASEDTYDERQYAEFFPRYASQNIGESIVSSDVTTKSTSIGENLVEQSIDSRIGEGYDGPAKRFSYPGLTHSCRTSLVSYGSTENSTPGKGFISDSMTEFEVEAKFNNLDVLSDEEIADNRLGTINSLTDNHPVFVRWDGNRAKIFKRGELQSDVSLRKEEVTSSMDISETYRSCKVIGRHGVEGDRIFSNKAPSYVRKDKTIRDRDIGSKSTANAEAIAFLEEHGAIEYQGQITTLPTLAPLGEQLSGSNFNHGQDMNIMSVRYGKRRTTVELGFEKDIAQQFTTMSKNIHSSHKEGTSKKETVPINEDFDE